MRCLGAVADELVVANVMQIVMVMASLRWVRMAQNYILLAYVL